MLRTLLVVSAAAAVVGYAPAGSRMLSHSRHVASRNAAVHMDETLFENILGDELEKEGAEKPWLSEAGWAVYLVSSPRRRAVRARARWGRLCLGSPTRPLPFPPDRTARTRATT